MPATVIQSTENGFLHSRTVGQKPSEWNLNDKRQKLYYGKPSNYRGVVDTESKATGEAA